jgi:flagellar biosynthesis/type III secretory pathway M-ring protein FliF/YscJ
MKGITGHQMAIIMSIIIAVIVIALIWIFLSKGSQGMQGLFDKIIQSFYGAICQLLGTWGGVFLPGMC